MAKISITDVLNDALQKYPGKPIAVELKKKDGYLVYEVEIVAPAKTVVELTVDAGNGAILKAEKEKGEKD